MHLLYFILFTFFHQALTKEPEFVAEDEFEESDLSDIEVRSKRKIKIIELLMIKILQQQL